MNFLGDKRSIFLLMNAVFMAAIAGCNSTEQKPLQAVSALVKPTLTQPFRFHKIIEVSPGNSFDIFSWGRGSAETGSFLILESDSAAAEYTTTTGDLDGTITDVYNTDMDMDGNPEILIQAKSKDSTKYTQIYAFEYKDNKAQKLDFPHLTSSQRKGYRGEDHFYIKEGTLMREFPVFDGKGDSAKVTADKRVLEYGIRSNSFNVKTVEQEDKNNSQSATDTAKTSSSSAAIASAKNAPQKEHQVSKRHRTTKKTVHKRGSNRSGKKNRRYRN
ncbi:MAG: hypothetical protein ACRYFA_00845 [Janthinobacterium lividum]